MINTGGGNSFALNQCLRFRSSTSDEAGPTNLLPFGVSVCRACCLAQFNSVDPHIDPDAITVSKRLEDYRLGLLFRMIFVIIHQTQMQLSHQ